MNLFRFEIEWVLLDIIGLVLSMANLVGYWKCSKGKNLFFFKVIMCLETKRKVEQWATTQALNSLYRRFIT